MTDDTTALFKALQKANSNLDIQRDMYQALISELQDGAVSKEVEQLLVKRNVLHDEVLELRYQEEQLKKSISRLQDEKEELEDCYDALEKAKESIRIQRNAYLAKLRKLKECTPQE